MMLWKIPEETATAFNVSQTSHNSRMFANPRIKIHENVTIEAYSFCRITSNRWAVAAGTDTNTVSFTVSLVWLRLEA